MSLYENPTINASITGTFDEPPLARARKASTNRSSLEGSPHCHDHGHGHGQPLGETEGFRPPTDYETASHGILEDLRAYRDGGPRPDYPNPLRTELLPEHATALHLTAECIGIAMAFRLSYGLVEQPAGVSRSLVAWYCGCSKQRAGWLIHELERRGLIVQAGQIDIPGRASPLRCFQPAHATMLEIADSELGIEELPIPVKASGVEPGPEAEREPVVIPTPTGDRMDGIAGAAGDATPPLDGPDAGGPGSAFEFIHDGQSPYPVRDESDEDTKHQRRSIVDASARWRELQAKSGPAA